ncbi:MAG: Mannonate dehydratase [uncultured Thermomicrobiales bacterium]|uniref:mannonate dehydratase n=1 Tax=uncultured Thermomicrobiales bacterium TaxID=1645740 RepID=A0A6J4UR80_9BACT|nr:MAG: Mannonate dehydratase [uncultured Thermomicrobiales bacterium]
MALKLKLAEVFPPYPSPLWTLAKQVGVTQRGDGRAGLARRPPPWDYMHLLALKQRFQDAGLELAVIESAPRSIMEPIKLGLPNRDERIERFCELIDNMGRVGIPIMCHNWMAGFGWLRTSMNVPGRGGALVTGYDHSLMRDAPLTEWGEITEEQLWENMTDFLKRVVPVAEKAGVKLAVHPDDPPLSPIRGIGRILTNPDAFQRVIDTVPSPNNGITFCQGNFAAMGADVPKEIRRFGGQGKIHFVHFRDVEGTPDRFVETFHDNGQTDMFESIRAYRDVDFDGPMRPDHVPTMAGEDNSRPGYEVMGRLYAIGYIKGLMEAVDKTS